MKKDEMDMEEGILFKTKPMFKMNPLPGPSSAFRKWYGHCSPCADGTMGVEDEGT